MRHVFISPHLDDAVLSAGDMIAGLVKKKKPVLVMTVFTDFGCEPIHWAARRYLWHSGVMTLNQFERLRKLEDKLAMTLLGVEYRRLGFTDGYFRKRDGTSLTNKIVSWFGLGQRFIYRNHRRLFYGKINADDKKTVNEVGIVIGKFISAQDIVFAPLGISGHVDHVIVNRAVKKIKAVKKYYWLDLPYAVIDEFKGNLEKIKLNYQLKFHPRITKIKYRALKQYGSQPLCRETIAVKPYEEFYEKTP